MFHDRIDHVTDEQQQSEQEAHRPAAAILPSLESTKVSFVEHIHHASSSTIVNSRRTSSFANLIGLLKRRGGSTMSNTTSPSMIVPISASCKSNKSIFLLDLLLIKQPNYSHHLH